MSFVECMRTVSRFAEDVVSSQHGIEEVMKDDGNCSVSERQVPSKRETHHQLINLDFCSTMSTTRGDEGFALSAVPSMHRKHSSPCIRKICAGAHVPKKIAFQSRITLR